MQGQTNTVLPGEYDANAVAHEIVDICVDRKAADVTLIAIGKVTTLSDYFVICSGTSARQVSAISRAIRDAMKERRVRLLADEGMPEDGWILLDYGQVIVHIFSPEQREFYDLEGRWREAPTLVRIQ